MVAIACRCLRHTAFAAAIFGTACPPPPPAGVQHKPWPLVHVSEPLTAHITRQALDRAIQLLGRPHCTEILDDFTDLDGHRLSERLATLHLDFQAYAALVVFLDDPRDRACRTGVMALTVPGERVVRLCNDELKRVWQQDPAYAAASFIHELLHTLGLAENPPSSREITKRVLARCGH
jgi:hypothetical protein